MAGSLKFDPRGLSTVPHSAVEIEERREGASPRRSVESRMPVKTNLNNVKESCETGILIFKELVYKLKLNKFH